MANITTKLIWIFIDFIKSFSTKSPHFVLGFILLRFSLLILSHIMFLTLLSMPLNVFRRLNKWKNISYLQIIKKSQVLSSFQKKILIFWCVDDHVIKLLVIYMTLWCCGYYTLAGNRALHFLLVKRSKFNIRGNKKKVNSTEARHTVTAQINCTTSRNFDYWF